MGAGKGAVEAGVNCLRNATVVVVGEGNGDEAVEVEL